MDKKNYLNELLVHLFNDILIIEENSLVKGEYKNLSMKEFHLIEAIGKDGNATMSMLAEKLRLTAGTLTSAVDNLIRKNYADRCRSKSDRRVVNVTLTELGIKALEKHDKFHDDMLDSIYNDLDPEESDALIKSAESLVNFFKSRN